MTDLMQQAISRLQALPEDRQDAWAHRILARVEEEQRKEAALLADLDEGLADLEEGRAGPVDFEDIKRRGRERLAAQQDDED